MTKAILITATALAAALQAQNNFQNPAWFGAGPNDAMHALRPDGQAGPVTGRPFSGVETRVTSQTLSDGTPTKKESVSKISRDAEGRMREESEKSTILFDAPNLMNYTINGAGCTQRTVRVGDSIVIAATDNGTWINTGTNIMTKLPSGKTGTANSNTRIATQDLGYQTVNGLSAQGTRQTITIPAKIIGSDHNITVVNERWYSDALGILIKSSNVDPRFGSTTYELSNINQSTPDAALFTPPTGCSESAAPMMRRQ